MDNDLISRAAIKSEIERIRKSTKTLTGIDFLWMIETFPAVDAVPVVHAQWVEEPDRHHHWHCSACGFTEGIVSRFYHYCPNCGAIMLEG